MRVEKITKRKRKKDNTAMMLFLGIGLAIWGFVGNFFNKPSIGLGIFLAFSIYAFVFLQRNDLGENKKQIKLKKQRYYKECQTFVFSRNYK